MTTKTRFSAAVKLLFTSTQTAIREQLLSHSETACTCQLAKSSDVHSETLQVPATTVASLRLCVCVLCVSECPIENEEE